MKAVTAQLAGQTVDGRAVSEAVKKRLARLKTPPNFFPDASSKLNERHANASHPSSGQGPQSQGLRPLLFRYAGPANRPPTAARPLTSPHSRATGPADDPRLVRPPASSAWPRCPAACSGSSATWCRRYSSAPASGRRLRRRDAHPHAAPRSVCRRRDERRVRADVHAHAHSATARTPPGGWARRSSTAAARHRRARRARDRVRRAARHGSYADGLRQSIPGSWTLTIELDADQHAVPAADRGRGRVMGMLNALRQFFAPASSPALFNVVFIAARSSSCRSSTPSGIEPVMALSVGMLLGGVAQIVVAVAGLAARRLPAHLGRSTPRDPALREVLFLMGPATLGVAAAQINLLVNTSLATSVEDGAAAGAQLRVSADVHAGRHLRRRRWRRRRFPIWRGTRPTARTTAMRGDAVVGHAADADAQRSGDGRADGAGRRRSSS